MVLVTNGLVTVASLPFDCKELAWMEMRVPAVSNGYASQYGVA